MPDRLRNKKSDKAKRNFDLNGKYSAKSIRLFELTQESRGSRGSTPSVSETNQSLDTANTATHGAKATGAKTTQKRKQK
jgi:hypothetical protein